MFEFMDETLIGKFFWIVGFVAMTLIRAPYQKARKTNVIADDRKTFGEKLLLMGAFTGMMILPAIYIFTPLLNFADYRLPLWAVIVGAALLVGGMWIFYLAHRDLGENWSPSLEVQANHKLVTDGIYQSIRHPMYAAIWLMVFSQTALLQNWIAGLSGLFFFSILYFARIPNEEKMMVERFGEEYRNYMRLTGRVFPKLF